MSLKGRKQFRLWPSKGVFATELLCSETYLTYVNVLAISLTHSFYKSYLLYFSEFCS